MDAQTFIRDLEDAQEKYLLAGRPDVVRLCAFWEWAQINIPEIAEVCFIYAYMMRELEFVDVLQGALQKGDGINTALVKCAAIEWQVRRTYTPALLWNCKHLFPSRLLLWSPSKLLELARFIRSVFKSQPTLSDYRKVKTMISKFKGVGVYTKEHFFRTLCIAAGKTEPCTDFIVMGSGAGKLKYTKLKSMGFKNMADLNRVLRVPITAGELANYLCLGKLLD
jgi:hypothetical protein